MQRILHIECKQMSTIVSYAAPPSHSCSCDKRIRQYCATLPSTLPGADGFMSSKSIASLKLVCSGLQRLHDTISSYEVSGVNVNLLSIMTLYGTFSFDITFTNGADVAATICTVIHDSP